MWGASRRLEGSYNANGTGIGIGVHPRRPILVTSYATGATLDRSGPQVGVQVAWSDFGK